MTIKTYKWNEIAFGKKPEGIKDKPFTFIHISRDISEARILELFKEYISTSNTETMFLYKFLNEEGKKFFGPYLEEIKQFEINNFYQLTDFPKSSAQNDFFHGLEFIEPFSDQKFSLDDAGILVQKFIKTEIKVDVSENEFLYDGSNYSFFKNYIATFSVQKSCNILNNIFEKIEYITDKYITLLSQNPIIPVFVIREMNNDPDKFLKTFSERIKIKPEIFIRQIREAIKSEEILPVDPVQLFINLISLCIFPFLARPLISNVFGMNEAGFEKFLNKRKKEIPEFIINSIRI